MLASDTARQAISGPSASAIDRMTEAALVIAMGRSGVSHGATGRPAISSAWSTGRPLACIHRMNGAMSAARTKGKAYVIDDAPNTSRILEEVSRK
jgi:hypothetical protein